MPKRALLLAIAMAAAFAGACRSGSHAASFTVSSPDGDVAVTLELKAHAQPYLPGPRAYYRVGYKGRAVLADSPLGLDFLGAAALDRDFEVLATSVRSNDSSWENPFGALRTVPDKYNELTVSLRERSAPGRRVDLVFRAYDEGAAFRYVLPKQETLGTFTLASETTGFYFAGEASAWALDMGRFNTHNEGEYNPVKLRDIKPASIINLPLLVSMPDGTWAALLEADLTDYAGLYVGGVPGIANALTARLSTPPGRKVEEAVVGATPKATPWRLLLLGSSPGRLVESNYIVLDLSAPCALPDTSWITPGRAAWDWWSGSFARNVPFKPGMNTATMKHYIDFAAAHGLEYMLVDAGWSVAPGEGRQEDILKYVPQVDVPDIIAYGKGKGVKVLLWVEWRAFDAHADEAVALYEKWGAAGVKIDYMNRDDQEMVAMYEKWVRKAAEHHLVVDYHGAYKGTGLRRTYPNLLTREGVMGMEYNKWSARVTPEHNVTIPFTRMLAGPMDFTPGAMRNAARGRFEIRDVEPMSQGTRAHQLAMYVVYESPLVMVSDYPEAYEGQPGLEFIEKVPTVWDETRVLAGEPDRFIVVARKKGGAWYLGAMTNWQARDLRIPLDFLGAGGYEAKVFADGPDAAEKATSLAVSTRPVTAADTLDIRLAPGGGLAAFIRGRASATK